MATRLLFNLLRNINEKRSRESNEHTRNYQLEPRMIQTVFPDAGYYFCGTNEIHFPSATAIGRSLRSTVYETSCKFLIVNTGKIEIGEICVLIYESLGYKQTYAIKIININLTLILQNLVNLSHYRFQLNENYFE